MGFDQVVQFTSEALILCVILSLPAVLVSSIVGLAVAFFQAVTSLQDQSISQGIKLLCVTVVVLLAAPWGASTLLTYTERLFEAMFK
ncbi:MAG TPA: type III secretion system export apparatus subunit SctS [Methylibium sp.]|uniref:type III secretion system export apparatus subunit SctS n=1 Tax=Methylibium sp. TaxID=2067992 RepID=UPI002DBD0E69|nr:type III secretion system export apparatus subunit SctS [Methylibium sp.]HEU4459595.1 type III secretion system export apparatus subunit SctS [Methylibium sp.]